MTHMKENGWNIYDCFSYNDESFVGGSKDFFAELKLIS